MLKLKTSIICVSLLYSVTCSGSIPKLTAQELIAKYSESSKYGLSQVTKSQTLVEFYQSQNDQEPSYELYKTEFRRHLDNFDIIQNSSLGFKEKDHPEIGKVQNTRCIWDTKLLYDHWFFNGSSENISPENPVIVSLHGSISANRNFCIGYYGAPFDGTFTGDLEPLPVILARSLEISIREHKEFVGNSECYIIDARGQNGKYTIWIDPEHGYNIIQAESEKTGRNIAYGTQMGDVATMPITGFKFSIKNIRLEEIQGHWVPMEGDFFIETTRGSVVSTTKRHHRRTSVELSPDFDKIGAFIPNIPNGTNILIMETPSIKYIWQDGKPITQIDQSFLDVLDGKIEQIKSAQEPNLLATIKTEKQSIVVNECNVPEVNRANQNNAYNTDNALPITNKEKPNYAMIITIGILVILVTGITIFYKLRRKQTNV